MPPRPARPAETRKKEPSYQIGIPLDGRERSALQPEGDRHDLEDTACEPGPPRKAQVTTAVSMPDDLPPPPAPPQAHQPETPPAQAAARPAATASDRSSPRGGPRSSRRAGVSSSSLKLSRTVSSRRTSVVDRRALLKVLLRIALGLLAATVLVAGIILLATRRPDGRQAGGEALAEASRQLDLVKAALSNRRGVDARKAYEAALKQLTATPELGGAVATPAEEKPVVRDLAFRAFELRGEVERINPRIIEVQDENAAESHLATLKGRFAALNDPATDLDALEKAVIAYCENPVDPASGPSPAHAQTFSRLAGEARLRLASISTERDRRKGEASVTPLRLAAVECDGLIQQERFGEALAMLEAMAARHAGADFAQLRAQVEDSAAKAWSSAKAKVDNHLADWKSPGATEGQRKAALAAAKERLNQVVERFGLATYVDEARAALTPLP